MPTLSCLMILLIAGFGCTAPTNEPSNIVSSVVIPVLCYHQYNAPLSYFSVSTDQFTSQMKYLYDLGYNTISPDLYSKALRGDPVNLPRNPILITFDDGIANTAPATWVMAKYNFRVCC